MTAYAELDVAIDAIKSAFDFIIKPYKPEYRLCDRKGSKI